MNKNMTSTIKLKPAWEYVNGAPVRKNRKKLVEAVSFSKGGACLVCGNVSDRWKDGSCRPCRNKASRLEYAKTKLDPEKYKAWLERSRALAQQRRDTESHIAHKPREDYIKDATPPWLTDYDLAEIEAVYFKARYLSRRTGISHVVDHIIPLNHPEVCGLHIVINLQVITAQENSVKKNAFFTDPNDL